ncbi:MAG: hypothetical protein IT379_15015 [Deltaproteobacteria bacterium]|nr:hypothetical protein [Deltaproteobacteria bacterium]
MNTRGVGLVALIARVWFTYGCDSDSVTPTGRAGGALASSAVGDAEPAPADHLPAVTGVMTSCMHRRGSVGTWAELDAEGGRRWVTADRGILAVGRDVSEPVPGGHLEYRILPVTLSGVTDLVSGERTPEVEAWLADHSAGRLIQDDRTVYEMAPNPGRDAVRSTLEGGGSMLVVLREWGATGFVVDDAMDVRAGAVDVGTGGANLVVLEDIRSEIQNARAGGGAR